MELRFFISKIIFCILEKKLMAKINYFENWELKLTLISKDLFDILLFRILKFV